MEIANLTAFLAVARHGSFSAAAASIHITQPAVSKRIAALEGELGAALFDRIGRRVVLTEAGQALLPRAQQVLDTLEDSRRAIANLAGEIEGPLVVGTSHHIGLRRLPPVLRRFIAAHPRVELDLRFMDSELACRAVEQGELELAVVTLPPQVPEALRMQTIWRDPLAVVAHPEHPLASLDRVTLKDLAAHPAVLPGVGTYTRGVVETQLRRSTHELRVSMSTNYLETLHMLVAVGLGWSVLPLTLVDDQVSVLAVETAPLERSLGLVTHHARTPSNAARAFMTTLAATSGHDRSPP